ncbi:MAG: hypothetical protein ACRDD1_19935, partial [Planctomycetia bacterium]
MDAAEWQKLFHSFRPEDQEALVVTTLGGVEIAVQQLVAVEGMFAVIRGRVAGQAEGGRVFLLP